MIIFCSLGVIRRGIQSRYCAVFDFTCALNALPFGRLNATGSGWDRSVHIIRYEFKMPQVF